MILPPRWLVRLVMTAVQQLRRVYWFVIRPTARGVHAVVLTGEGKIVLVRHSYAKGWRLPGGGIKAGETPVDAVLRELREEIGLTAWRDMRHVLDFEHRPDFRRGHGSLFRIDDAVFSPRPSLEIDDVEAFDPARLPAEATPFTRQMIAKAMAR